MNKLFYGDNLDVMRKFIRDETVDLCYIDPPFNSKRDYNQIYNNIGTEDRAQAQAFTDTWTWDDHASQSYEEILTNNNGVQTQQSIALINGLEKGSRQRLAVRLPRMKLPNKLLIRLSTIVIIFLLACLPSSGIAQGTKNAPAQDFHLTSGRSARAIPFELSVLNAAERSGSSLSSPIMPSSIESSTTSS